jgi:large subunit ribosomal protein L22
MAFEAKLRHLKISPRKVRLVADMIRGKKAEEAQTILGFAIKKGAEPVLKLLNSALANAKNNNKAEISNLIVSKIIVDEGPIAKRIMPRAKGKGDRIMKRSSHVTLALDVIRGPKKNNKKKQLEKTETKDKDKKEITKTKVKEIKKNKKEKIIK